MFNIKKDKKGAGIPAMFVSVFAIIGLVAAILWFAGGGTKTTGLSVSPQQLASQPVGSGGLPTINLVDKTTVTYASWDAYQKSSNAGTGHLVLSAQSKDGRDKFVGKEYNDDGTETLAPGDGYKVLIGNVTKSTQFTSGTTYYPSYITGVIPDIGAYSISAGQYKTAGLSQVTFTFKNNQGTVGSAQALGLSDDKTVTWTVQPNANTCVGNPDTRGNNIVTYHYNSSVITTLEQYNNGVLEGSTGTPNGVQGSLSGTVVDYSRISYPFPVVCGPAEASRQVRMKTGATNNPASEDNVNVSISDVTWGWDSYSFELIKGYQDNNAVDLGMTDFVVGSLLLS